jgi:hypothetical protein
MPFIMRTSFKDLQFLVELINRKSVRQYSLDLAYGSYRLIDNESRNISPRLITSQMYLWLSGFLEAIVIQNS